jgi:fucose 4-O-acetylase-like acetyltransferase
MTAIASKERDFLFDNLKFVLITFVVFAHFIEPFIDQSITIKGLFVGIYFFHMPFFIFISGYFSKSVASQSIESNLRNLFIPYLIFSSLWYLKDDLVFSSLWFPKGGFHITDFSLNVVIPPFHFWYFLSLFFWRLTLKVVQKIRSYFVVSIVIALLIGFTSDIGQPLSLSRTITLFPFFILGTLCSEDVIKDLHKKKYWIPVGIAAWCTLDYIMMKFYPDTFSIVFWDESYMVATGSKLIGFAERSVLFVVAILSSLAVLALTPAKKSFMSAIGAKTLPIYAFHAFLVPRFMKMVPLWNESLLINTFIIVFPFLLVGVLSLPIFEKLYMAIVGFLQPAIRKTAN